MPSPKAGRGVCPQSAPKTSSQQPQRKTTQYKILWDTLNVLAGHPGWHAWSPFSLPPATRVPSPASPPARFQMSPPSIRSFFLGYQLSSLGALFAKSLTLHSPLVIPRICHFSPPLNWWLPKLQPEPVSRPQSPTTYKTFPSDSHKHLQLKFSQKLNSSFSPANLFPSGTLYRAKAPPFNKVPMPET